MKHPSIFETMRSIQRFPLRLQHAHLSALLAEEPPRSIRRGEIEAALRHIVTRALKAEIRGRRKVAS